MDKNLLEKSAIELKKLIIKKEISPVELIESCIERTESVNVAVNAIVTANYENARLEAKVAEKAVLDGDELGLIHGLPVAIKDLESTKGIRTTMGSLIYEKNVPDADQLSVSNIRSEGGIILGKTNTPEFGAGANTKNRVFGVTKNPFDTELSCAGSSGGSAVSLACGMAPLALLFCMTRRACLTMWAQPMLRHGPYYLRALVRTHPSRMDPIPFCLVGYSKTTGIGVPSI